MCLGVLAPSSDRCLQSLPSGRLPFPCVDGVPRAQKLFGRRGSCLLMSAFVAVILVSYPENAKEAIQEVWVVPVLGRVGHRGHLGPVWAHLVRCMHPWWRGWFCSQPFLGWSWQTCQTADPGTPHLLGLGSKEEWGQPVRALGPTLPGFSQPGSLSSPRRAWLQIRLSPLLSLAKTGGSIHRGFPALVKKAYWLSALCNGSPQARQPQQHKCTISGSVSGPGWGQGHP